jgi:flagellar hook-associated protein 3 FlgL
MRVATNQYAEMMTTALATATSQMDSINLQLATGDAYTVPSQDPIAYVRLSRLSRDESDIAQYQNNISTLQDRLSNNESILDGISKDILSAHDLLVQAANGANSAADEGAISTALQPLLSSIMYAANTKNDEGYYEFSGTLTSTPAITYNAAAAVGSRYTFTGNSNQQMVSVASGVSQPANLSLPEMATLLNQLDVAQNTLGTAGVNVNSAPVQGQIDSAMDAVATGLGAISGKISTIGGQQNILTTMNTNFSNISLTNQQTASNLGQVNYANAYTELTGDQAAVQAAQKAYSDVSKLSLFNAL